MSIEVQGAGAGGITDLRQRARSLVPELDTVHVAQDDCTYWKKHDVIAIFDHDPAMLSLVKREYLRYWLVSGAAMIIGDLYSFPPFRRLLPTLVSFGPWPYFRDIWHLKFGTYRWSIQLQQRMGWCTTIILVRMYASTAWRMAWQNTFLIFDNVAHSLFFTPQYPGWTHVFPVSDIVDIGPKVTDRNYIVVSLIKPFPNYKQPRVPVSSFLKGNCQFSIIKPREPALLRKLVMALKQQATEAARED